MSCLFVICSERSVQKWTRFRFLRCLPTAVLFSLSNASLAHAIGLGIGAATAVSLCLGYNIYIYLSIYLSIGYIYIYRVYSIYIGLIIYDCDARMERFATQFGITVFVNVSSHIFIAFKNDFSTVLEYCVPCGSLAGVYRMFVHLRGTLYMPMSAFVSWLKEWPSLQVPAVAKVGK